MEKTQGQAPSIEKQVQVVVLGHSRDEICVRGWGPRRSSEETTRQTQAFLSRVYGDRVDVSYYDAALPAIQEKYRQVLSLAAERYLPHPLVLVDDQLVMAGHVDAYGLASLVTEKLS